MQISEHVAHEALGDQVVLLDLQVGRYFSLEGSGARIWQLIAEGYDQSTIVAQLMHEYDASETQLTTDVAALTQDLLERGLLCADATVGHK